MNTPNPSDISSLLMRFVVTSDKVRDMEDRTFIWRNNLSKGFVHAWCAPANGGKSVIAKLAAAEIAAKGFDVFYFHEDAGASELRELQQDAAANDYNLLNTCLAGSDTATVMAVFESILTSEIDLSNVVLIFDTLKKFTDVMHKGDMTKVGTLFRFLTIRGATVLLLHHTTKREDKEGKKIFDGVGDLRNDIDELHYIHSLPSENGENITFTVTPDKVRSFAQSVSFSYNKETRELSPLETSIDVVDALQVKKMHGRDAGIKIVVRDELRNGAKPITALALRVQETMGVNEKRVRAVIKRWTQNGICPEEPEWYESRMPKNNVCLISSEPFE
jgi:hypothetical protein